MSLLKVRKDRCELLVEEIASLERSASYLLGEDYFRIDHGLDYFAFFTRLGRLSYYAFQLDGRVAAVAAAVLREVPIRRGRSSQKTW